MEQQTMDSIRIQDGHLPHLARLQHVLEWLQTERARLEHELTLVVQQGARMDAQVVAFLQRNYGLDAAHTPGIQVDTDTGYIRVPSAAQPAVSEPPADTTPESDSAPEPGETASNV